MPEEGWLPLLFLTVALYSVVYSIVAANWVGHSVLLLLSPAIGLLIGVVISKVPRVPQPVMHLAACLVGHWLAIWITSSMAYHVSWLVLLGNLREAFTGQLTTGSTQTAEMLFFFYLTFLTYFLGYFGSWLVYRARLPWLVGLVYSAILLVNLNYIKVRMDYLVIILGGSLLLLIAHLRLINQIHQWKREGLYTDRAWTREITRRCMQIACAITVFTLCMSWILPVAQQSQSGKDFWDRINTAWTNIVSGHVSLQNPSGIMQPYQAASDFFGDQLTITGSVHLPMGEVLHYNTNTNLPRYLEGFTYSNFDGHTWTSAETSGHNQAYDRNSDLPIDAAMRGATAPLTTSITVVNPPHGSKYYIFGPAQPAQFNVKTSVYSGDDGTITSWVQQDALTVGEQYQVTSLEPVADAQVLTSVPLPKVNPALWKADKRYSAIELYYTTQVPKGLSLTVSTLATQWTDGATDEYTAMKALERHLGDQNVYTYSVDNPPIPANTNVVDWLLQHRIGYCTYYASAMAVMGRIIGVPTRIVNGFSHGHYNTQHKYWEVDGSDAHSWVQAYFPKYGWVNFDPTPGYSFDTQQPQHLPTPTPGAATPTPKPALNVTPQVSPPAKYQGPIPPSNTNTHKNTTSHANAFDMLLQAVLPWLTLFVLLISVLCLLAALLTRWWRNLYAGSSFIAAMFWRLCWIASRAGYSPEPWQTPYEYSNTLSEQLEPRPTPLWRLTELFVRDRWGPPHVLPHADEEKALEQQWPTLRNMFLQLFFRRGKKK